MGDIINLRQARKTRARADKARVAEVNRARFGRTKAQKATDALESARHDKIVDGARLGADDADKAGQ